MFLLCSPIYAKSDKEAVSILDKTSAAISAGGDLSVEFKASYFDQPNEPTVLNGKLLVSGIKLYVESDCVTYWFDGETLWTYIAGSDEVNLSTPTAEEQQAINPYFFLTLYKNGFEATLDGEQTLRGQDCNTIRLNPRKKGQKIQQMLVDISKQTNLPVCVRFKNASGTWIRISILECQLNQNIEPGTFRFNPEQHPDLEVIDLR